MRLRDAAAMLPLLLLLATAASLAGPAAATAVTPFVNWHVLREGAPREEHVQALQLAKVRD